MTPLMVPPAKYPTYIAIISSVFAISSVLGPLLGGAISDHTTWRCVFWLKYVWCLLIYPLVFQLCSLFSGHLYSSGKC
jgi:predicted MFS family arabinose efflux permease